MQPAQADLNQGRDALPFSSGLSVGWIQLRTLGPAKEAEGIPSLGAVSPARVPPCLNESVHYLPRG